MTCLCLTNGQIAASGQQRLLVAEDSCVQSFDGTRCGHINNAVWAINTQERRDATRILTSPYLSKLSSVAWHPDIFRKSLISVVISEPYDGERSTFVDERGSTGPRAWFGFIGSFRNRVRALLFLISRSSGCF